jgi:hypothetical protein
MALSGIDNILSPVHQIHKNKYITPVNKEWGIKILT